jgi:hypothetical protein
MSAQHPFNHGNTAISRSTSFLPHSLGRLVLAVALGASLARAVSIEPLFAKPTRWGSDAQFNPVSMVLNEGWDITQLENRENRIAVLNGSDAFRRLGRTMSHPLASIRREGPGSFFFSEIVPTSMRAEKAQWIPNYQLHLVGGGILNVKAEQWYRDNGYASPKLMALATSATAWVLNEASEISQSSSDFSTDPVADLLLFDLAGVLVFQSTAVRSIVFGRMEAMNWPLQPSLDPRDGRVLNAGQYYAFKMPLPSTRDWKFFYHMGLGNIAGLSRRVGAGHSLSVGGGAHATRIVQIDSTRNSAALAPKIGLFWDHDNSLWASVFYNGQSVQRFSVQIYPTPWTSWPIPLGFWGTFGGPRGLSLGLSANLGIGLGWSGI